MAAVVIHSAVREPVRIPEWVSDLASFRRWAVSDDFPERGWYSHLGGELWVDLSMETLVHNKVKTEFGRVLETLAKRAGSGSFLGDRMLLTHVEAELSTEPDGMFLSHASLREGRVRLEKGEESLEVEGSPDMVLEVVSQTSVQKDTILLRDLYWRAGVREYWLADPRGEQVALDILRHARKGYSATRKQGGWVKSAVFEKAFRMTREQDPVGHVAYTLEVR